MSSAARLSRLSLLIMLAACGKVREDADPSVAVGIDADSVPMAGVAAERTAHTAMVDSADGRTIPDSPGNDLDVQRHNRGMHIVVSNAQRSIWLVDGQDTILSGRAAVGRTESAEFGGRRYDFTTPTGQRRVLKKERDPLWTPPDWHYLEKAELRGLELVRLERGRKYELGDGTHLEIRGDHVGRTNRFGNWWPFTAGTEIIFDRTLYMPPFGTEQRRVPGALGRFKLDLGDGYLIHGTNSYNAESVGQAVSHGCVRLDDDLLEDLYSRVEVGTPVYIF